MNKTAIKNYAIWARNKLIADIEYKAGLLGVSEKGAASPLPQSRGDVLVFDIGTGTHVTVEGKDDIARRNSFVAAIRNKAQEPGGSWAAAFQSTLEKIAYTWFNRLAAIRFMEVNGYLPVRVLSSDNPGKAEPDMVTRPFDMDLSFSEDDREYVLRLKEENHLNELFRWLFIRQCRKLGDVLPRLFTPMSEYMELLLTISFTDKDGVLWHLVHDIPEDDFNVEKEGQVEIIGWLYQYYNTEPKDKVFADLKKNVKVSRDKIPAATQLFTPDWIVRYMVENSLGRLWAEGHPGGDLKKSWKYYLEEAPQEPAVQAQLAEIRKGHASLRPEDIRVIDPCMGSGHILVYLFHVLMQIYESQGWTRRDAARSIVENNLYGLDIDDRAAQLAYFAVMMKACQYDKRFLTRDVQPHVYSTSSFPEGAEYGSLMLTEDPGPAPEEEYDLSMPKEERQVRHILSQQYHVVVTNPPYMGAGNMNRKLSEFVKKYYPDAKSDMSTVFMERTLSMCKSDGYMAMINIPVWMFLSSYEKLRDKIIHGNTFISMVHPGRGIFGSDFGTTTFVIGKIHIDNYTGHYRRLFDKQGEVESIEEREQHFFEGRGLFYAKQSNFSKIPGSPVAYWVSSKTIDIYANSKLIRDYGDTRQGIATGENNRFLRFWYEPNYEKVACPPANLRKDIAVKWYPYHKGGEYRKWYGNNDYVVNWDNGGFEIRNFYDEKGKLRSRPQNLDYAFKKCVTWSLTNSSSFGARFRPDGFMFDINGMSLFIEDKLLKYALAYLCSTVATALMKINNPTLASQAGDIARLPFIVNEKYLERIDNLTLSCITKEKEDWDSFETSWDFEMHPIVKKALNRFHWGHEGAISLEYVYKYVAQEFEERFQSLKADEEELNRIFIDIYGLQDELTPEVEDKDVTVRLADLGRDIRSLISYAVGCMFGRYSLDAPGLAYAGGAWDSTKYRAFQPDADNCIPITDEPYFEDDIVGRFVEFIRVVYGKDTLEENLRFIAGALGGKGNSSRDVIRRYFLNDFYKDHVKIYQKRPIYWLFDAGKQNGFKALVYMHRWNADTVGHLRVEYLHRMQRVYEKEIELMQDTEANSKDNREITLAAKRREKLMKQLKETRDYDTRLAHAALSRIDIDLDDGVKVNYEKVQKGPDGKSLGILAKI